ncbi:rod shape-determining protein MreD [Candidatus Synechococcus calcipolaris G9]|uniref:Rod shape-determining protein MreD n=1 Tax=Candidatus Synechococcus calcipolaris G9 TaxID=1497997 RepID=A0ABT6EX61_9SYNE|nr:rod shape-determining protein MreD [Candidatus Synechococcus calcipolaris]MDG2990402.1 rod shape-determining protein MreD [Candidatus Synechococcus calcipolaris G9]
MTTPLSQFSTLTRTSLNALVTLGSVVICAMLMLVRLPYWQFFSPDWLLIWVVVWSVKRSPWQGFVAGVCLGWIQDGLSTHYPSHALSLAIVGGLTGLMQKQRFISEDFISIALIAFAMAMISETINAAQISLLTDISLPEIWQHHRQIALSSAILSSLWAPLIYAPLNLWWSWVQESDLD